MAVSTWITIPSSDPDHWPANNADVWIRMRDWPRVPVKATTHRTGDPADAFGGVWFQLIADDLSEMDFGVAWPAIGAWQPRT